MIACFNEVFWEMLTASLNICLPRQTYINPGEDDLEYDVHFWIGKYSTQDEYGTAAYKTVELDTFLDDKPIQHREVQGWEKVTNIELQPKHITSSNVAWWVRLLGCLGNIKLPNAPWSIYSFAKILTNEPLKNIEVNQELLSWK